MVRERRRLSPPAWEAASLLWGHLFPHESFGGTLREAWTINMKKSRRVT